MVLSLLKIEVDVNEDLYMKDFTRYDPLVGFVHNLGTS